MGLLTWLVALVPLFAPVSASAPAERLPAATVTIDSFVTGGQAELDAGFVVSLGCGLDEGCPVWLAGHRSTHGAVFAAVALLVPGDTVAVLGVRFVVTGHDVICCVGQRFAPSADLTLQTSATATLVHLVTARRL